MVTLISLTRPLGWRSLCSGSLVSSTPSSNSNLGKSWLPKSNRLVLETLMAYKESSRTKRREPRRLPDDGDTMKSACCPSAAPGSLTRSLDQYWRPAFVTNISLASSSSFARTPAQQPAAVERAITEITLMMSGSHSRDLFGSWKLLNLQNPSSA